MTDVADEPQELILTLTRKDREHPTIWEFHRTAEKELMIRKTEGPQEVYEMFVEDTDIALLSSVLEAFDQHAVSSIMAELIKLGAEKVVTKVGESVTVVTKAEGSPDLTAVIGVTDPVVAAPVPEGAGSVGGSAGGVSVVIGRTSADGSGT